MSKKIAEGIGAPGPGRQDRRRRLHEDAGRLARPGRSLVAIGNASGVRTEALITAMDAPLGRMVGNAIEVIESVDMLKGKGPADLEELSVLFAARMLVLAGLEREEGPAVARARAAIGSGAALEAFRRIIENQGGDPRIIDDYSHLPSAPDETAVRATRAGHVAGLHAEAIGRAAVALGAGRARLEDIVDPGVGIRVEAPVGARVAAGDAVMLVRHRGSRGVAEAMKLLVEAIRIDDEAPPARPLIVDRVGEG